MSDEVSALESQRRSYRPQLPEILEARIEAIGLEEGAATTALTDADDVRGHFPQSFGRPHLRFVRGAGPRDVPAQRVGVVLSGGQAPGGHNVIAGLLDGIRRLHSASSLLGFLGGPQGIFNGRHVELTPERVEPYRNTGGFDMIGSGRDKIETRDQLAESGRVCESLKLSSLVIVGGDDSNTNAAVLAEHFLQHGLQTRVVGVPKTIDGDLRSEDVELSFGFDTGVKVYSELIGNICRDAKSSAKYWHFVRLMGRSASHVTLECALQTRPNMALIGEEVRRDATTLGGIVDRIAGLVRRRSELAKNYGVVLVPEGLIEFIPEMRTLIGELNLQIGGGREELGEAEIRAGLSATSRATFDGLPGRIRRQLLMDRDSHGNVQVSPIDTEQLLILQVGERLAEWTRAGNFSGPFKTQSHFLGYEGRCAAPTNFDAAYTYCLGRTAALIGAFGKTGYMCSVRNLVAPTSQWAPAAVPLTAMMGIEQRKGVRRPVIVKALVDLSGRPFAEFAARRTGWETDDAYLYPGAIQYFGPPAVADLTTKTLQLERGNG